MLLYHKREKPRREKREGKKYYAWRRWNVGKLKEKEKKKKLDTKEGKKDRWKESLEVKVDKRSSDTELQNHSAPLCRNQCTVGGISSTSLHQKSNSYAIPWGYVLFSTGSPGQGRKNQLPIIYSVPSFCHRRSLTATHQSSQPLCGLPGQYGKLNNAAQLLLMRH